MNILIIAVGKDSSAEVQSLQNDYERRLKPFTSVEWKLVPAAKLPNEAQVRDSESMQILAMLKPTDSIILLDERGTQLSNEAFAVTYERLAGAHGRLVCIIGGAYGVNDELRKRASFVWSLSKLVFPHQIVRIMLLEQIYRTYSVLNNHPYHHA